MSHLVRLDAFHGPLDLLLYLVKRNEVDVLDIPIATIAEQFLGYVLAVKELDIEFAGEFLVMSATLMEIKSRTLLPADAQFAPDDQPDPRRELVRQLLEYRKFKDAAAALEARAEEAAERLARVEPPDPNPVRDRTPNVRPVELWDLVSAFARLMRETQALQPATIAVDDTPQHVHEAQLLERVAAAGGRLPFRDAFPPPHTKPRLIGVFLAVLELIRHHGLGLDQPDPVGDIFLVAASSLPPAPDDEPSADGSPEDEPPAPEPANVS
ncbi:segregation/condensation protein A [Gemmata sp. JC717]|uniref:segregation and condensation protein A n=1 Tax=Gemmata algarum TaxID=2975278 RepID=UPI0021BB363E|nr:segregation/condensation protein A [Gemmata algarum]MDY3554668.1 segregation/condensation protein A [Gemmata algarum]